jgi:uncharacterized protein
MIVVSDTSPISNLIQIDCLFLLEKLFGKIVIPTTVFHELCVIETQKTILGNTTWISVQEVIDANQVATLEMILDKGEAEAIVLAQELEATQLLIDERKGRTEAERRGLKIVGILGILIKAKQEGLISFVKPYLNRLVSVGFRINPRFLTEVLTLVDEA